MHDHQTRLPFRGQGGGPIQGAITAATEIRGQENRRGFHFSVAVDVAVFGA